MTPTMMNSVDMVVHYFLKILMTKMMLKQMQYMKQLIKEWMKKERNTVKND